MVNLAHLQVHSSMTSPADTDAIVDLSVWPNCGALQAAATLANGHESVAWWRTEKQHPDAAEGFSRLQFLRQYGPSPYAFEPFAPRDEFTIDRVFLDNADVQLLISQLNSDLYSRYPEPEALIFSLHPDDIVDGVGVLLMAVHDGMPVGCGAFRVIDDQPGTAEIKRLYVCLAGRGKKIGAALLTELERRASAIGVDRLVLETGPRQPEAMHRFGRAGFVGCEPWGQFVGREFSICMEKTRIG